jgi:hypothetical protein
VSEMYEGNTCDKTRAYICFDAYSETWFLLEQSLHQILLRNKGTTATIIGGYNQSIALTTKQYKCLPFSRDVNCIAPP